MPSAKILSEKQAYVADLKAKFESAVSGCVVAYGGINVENDTKLRKELREAGVDYMVVKNTMLRLAVKGTSLEGLAENFKGDTAVAFAHEEDPMSAARILPFQRVAPGAVVRGNDAVSGRAAVCSPQIQAFAVAADRGAANVRSGQSGLFQGLTNHPAVGLPHLIHIPLRETGPGNQHGGVHPRRGDFQAVFIENGGFGGSAAVVQSQIIFHDSSFPHRDGLPVRPGVSAHDPLSPAGWITIRGTFPG